MRYDKTMPANLFTNFVVCALAVLLGCLNVVAEENLDPAPQVLFLHTEFVSDFPENRRKNLLARELFRQAILLTAREELGVSTCDETLRETPPKDAEVIHVFLKEYPRSHSRWRVQLYDYDRGKDKKAAWKTFWKKDYDYDKTKHKIYADLATKLESDTRDQMVKALLSAGFRKQRTVRAMSKPVSHAHFEKMLGQVDFITQFAAVRAAHQAIRANGESPELMGFLVRGYANLAFLTRHHYNATSSAFTARSWLYAQRLYAQQLMTTTDSIPIALWHRAYAWALGGTFHEALTDLGQLSRVENPQLKEFSPLIAKKDWTTLIEAYCKSDRAATKEIGEQVKVLKPWATRLWFELTTVYQQDAWNFHASEEVFEITPTAYGVYAEMARSGTGSGTSRTGALGAPLAFGEHFPMSMDAAVGMPREIRGFLPTNGWKRMLLQAVYKDPNPRDAFSGATKLIAQLLREQSRKKLSGDLSWSSLAYLLEEEQFVQIANQLSVSLNDVERPLYEEVDAVLPLVEKHRYAGYIDSFRYHKNREAEKIEKALAGMTFEDPRGNMRRMFRHVWDVGVRDGRGIGKRASRNKARNFTFRGLLDYYFPSPSKWRKLREVTSPSNVRAFRAIVPYSDISLRFTINCARKPTLNLLKLWEAEIVEDATAYSILGRRYSSLDDRNGASRCFEKSLKLLPNWKIAKKLADLHWQKDFGKWKKAYLDFLESEDLGLQHAHAQIELAHGYAHYGLWADAKKHAEIGGQSGSAWGMWIASYTCESLAEWEKSEEWMRNVSESYPSSSGQQWYFWCRRTGRGDVQEARILAEERFPTEVANEIVNPTRNGLVSLGTYCLLDGDEQGALEAYQKANAFGPTFTCSLMIAQLAHRRGDKEMRDRVLLEMSIASEQSREEEEYDEAANAAGLEIIELLKSADASQDRLEQLDKLLAKVGNNACCAFSYFVGMELEELGEMEKAEKYLRRALVLPYRDPHYSTLAGYALANRHGTSRPDDDPLGKEDLWPTPQDEGQPE